MKKLLIVAALGLGLLLLVLGVAVFYAGSIAKQAVERGGTFALGVPTTLDSVELGLFSGHLGLDELIVENPKSFDAPHFLRLQQADLDVSLESLSSDLVEVQLLSIHGLALTLERKGGRTNYEPILERLQSLQSPGSETAPEPETEAPDPDGSQKKFVIREVVITDVSARIALLPQGGSLTEVKVTIPELRIKDLGHGGASLPEVIGELTRALLSAVVEAGGDDLPAAVLGDLVKGLGSRAGLDFDLGQGFKTEVERLGEALGEDLGKELGRQLEDASEALGAEIKQLFD